MEYNLLLKRLALILVGVLLASQLFFWLRNRKRISRLFDGIQIEKSAIASIEDALAVINSQSSDLTFGMRRLTSLTFRGEKIFLVSGRVGYVFASGQFGMKWRTQESIYTVADASQSEWMQRNRDVFKPAFTGTSFSVFWVRVSLLK